MTTSYFVIEQAIIFMLIYFIHVHTDHITSPTAVVLPVKRITEVCHKHGVVVVVDAAHVPGQLKVDIQDIDADFYTGDYYDLSKTFIRI